jgi:hypothetical protein
MFKQGSGHRDGSVSVTGKPSSILEYTPYPSHHTPILYVLPGKKNRVQGSRVYGKEQTKLKVDEGHTP